MNAYPISTRAATVLLCSAVLALAGCSTVSKHLPSLPWSHKATAPPEVSTALTVAAPDGTALGWPQFWQRNDVVLDMSGISGSGSAVVMPRTGLAWPVRVAVRVTRGAFGSLEVRGAQRLVMQVPSNGAGTVDLELPPGVYIATTRQMSVSWGPSSTPPAP